MTKRVYRYFFDFIDGQEKWLNEMSANGWRLIKCGQLSYDFESCPAGVYEYAVDFVAEKPYSKSKEYMAFLESMGYKTFYRNVNVGVFIGKIKWRPWAEGAGQITAAPGSFQKELLIVEKKKDGKPFELHTDLADSLAKYKKLLIAYLWVAIGMIALAILCVGFAILLTPYAAIGALFCAALGALWLIPAIKLAPKVRRLMGETETNEHETQPVKKTVLKIIATMAIPLLLISIVSGALYFSGAPLNSYSARDLVQSSWGNQWNASYSHLNGSMQRRVSLDQGTHSFAIEMTTESGEISLSITGEDGTKYYKGSNMPTSTFAVQVDADTKTRLTLQVNAKDHSGGYKVKWD